MAEYRISNAAKEDLIRIHHYGIEKFGIIQADKYLNSFNYRINDNMVEIMAIVGMQDLKNIL